MQHHLPKLLCAALAAFALLVVVPSAPAQDAHDGYWEGYWDWYDHDFAPRFHRGHYYPHYGYPYYSHYPYYPSYGYPYYPYYTPYYTSYYTSRHAVPWPHHSLEVGPLHIDWY